MRWNDNEVKDNGWETRFAFFPVQLDDGTTIWLERYAEKRTWSILLGWYVRRRDYEGCAVRVGYRECDCYRH